MNLPIALAVLSLLISVVSAGIAVASFVRTKKFQDLDYRPRLQFADQHLQGNDLSTAGKVFEYSASLENVGPKPVHVRDIYMDYGDRDPAKCFKYHLEGHFHLPTGGKRPIEFSLAKNDFDAVLKKFGIEHCHFSLRIVYDDTAGRSSEIVRNLMGLGKNPHVTVYAQAGDALT